jgi:anti-sigma factor RsiW
MMALGKKMLEQEPGEIEMLLPWHAAGTLNARDARRVEEALARDPELARQYAVIREEYAETIDLNESLGAPSARAMQKLFATIDADPAQKPKAGLGLSSRISSFFARLSPRTVAWSASLGALALLLQAGVIGAILMKSQPATYETAALRTNDPQGELTRGLGQESPNAPASRALKQEVPPRALVRFAPDARMADITALLDSYQASIVDGAKGGMFRLQFGSKAMTKDEVAALMRRLQSEKIVDLAVATP